MLREHKDVNYSQENPDPVGSKILKPKSLVIHQVVLKNKNSCVIVHILNKRTYNFRAGPNPTESSIGPERCESRMD